MAPYGYVSVASHVLTQRINSEVPPSPVQERPCASDAGVRVQIVNRAVEVDCFLSAALKINLQETDIDVQSTSISVPLAFRGVAGKKHTYLRDAEVGHG